MVKPAEKVTRSSSAPATPTRQPAEELAEEPDPLSPAPTEDVMPAGPQPAEEPAAPTPQPAEEPAEVPAAPTPQPTEDPAEEPTAPQVRGRSPHRGHTAGEYAVPVPQPAWFEPAEEQPARQTLGRREHSRPRRLPSFDNQLPSIPEAEVRFFCN